MIRGLAGGLGRRDVRDALGQLLADPATTQIELLAAISGRAWELLGESSYLQSYLERLAENEHGQDAFSQCVSDLLSVPVLTDKVRAQFRDPKLSQRAREAFGNMTSQTTTT